jgi:transcription elongation GreA/GreB family factor
VLRRAPIRLFARDLERSSSVANTAASSVVDTAAIVRCEHGDVVRCEHGDVVRTDDAAPRGAGDTVEG